MSNDLRVGIIADASQLGGQMDAAGAKVESFADRAASAMERYNAASLKGKEAQEALGVAFDKATAAGKTTTEAMEEAVAAYESLNSVSGQVVASQERVAAAINTVGVSSRQAATAGIGILEGRMMSGNRAAAAFLTTTLGLGPAIQAAFPIIGALAMAEVLYDIGKGAYEAYEKFVSLDAVTEKLTKDIQKMREHDVINVHSIETATERFNDANAAATNLHETATALHDLSMRGLFKDLASGNIGGAVNDASNLLTAKRAATEGARNTMDSIALGVKELELKHQLRDAQIEAAHAGDSALQPEQRISAELSKQLELHKEAQQYEHIREKTLGNKSPDNAGEEMRKIEDAASYAKASAERANLNKKAISEYVQESLNAAKNIESEEKRITETITANAIEGIKGEEAERKRAEESEHRAAEEWKKEQEEKNRLADKAANDAVKWAAEQEAIGNRNIAYREKMGQESPKAAAQDRSNTSQATENEQVAALQAARANYDPNLGGDQAQKYQEIQDKITDIQRKGSAQREQIVQQEALREAQKFNSVFSQVTGPLNTFVDYWMTHTHRMGAAFEHMGDQIALNLIGDLEKMGEKWLEHETFVTVQHLLGIGQRQAADTTAKAAAAATQSAADVAQVISYAAVAAAGAAASVAAIPIVGPELAPAAAATVFASTSAYTAPAAFAVGTDYVPKTGLAMIHEGERIIPSNQNQQITKALTGDGGGGRGGDSHLHVHQNFSNWDGTGVEGAVRRSNSAAMRQFNRQMRLMGRTQG